MSTRVPPATDHTIHVIVIVGANADAQLRPHRIENPGTRWIAVRLDRALAGAESPDAPVPRGEIMGLVGDLDPALTRDGSDPETEREQR